MNSVWGVISRYAGILTAGVFVITVGWAQAADVTPSDASMVLNGDTLVVQPAGSSGVVTSTCASASADSTLTYALASKVQIGKGANTSVTLQVGNTSPSATPILVRSNRAVLVIVPTNGLATGNFGVNEKFKVTGSGANLPAVVNGMVSASIVGRPYPDADWTSMCFLTYDAVKGFIPVTTEQTGFTGSDNTKIVYVSSATTLAANTACYALRHANNITINSGVTLTVGNGAGQAGVLADLFTGQNITGGGTLDFGAAELVYHTAYHPGSPAWNSANVHTLSCQVTGSGGITVACPDGTVLKLNNISNTFSGGLTILGGRVDGDYGAYMDYYHSFGAGVISIANGAGLAGGNRAVLTNNVYLLGGDPNLAAKFSSYTILSNTISGPGNLGCNDPSVNANLCEIYGSNTFTGSTIIYKSSGGNSSLKLYHNSALGAGTGPVVFSNGTSTVTLSVNNYNPKIGTLCGPTNNIVDLGNSSSTRLTIGNDNGTGEFAGTIINQGTLVKIGTGTQILSGVNTYYNGSGTIVSNGTLVINGSVTGAVTVVSGGTLGGTGVVTGVVTNFGTITAADKGTVGTMTVTNLVMKENSTYYWDYNATTNDTVNVTGNLTLPNVATVNVNQVSSGRMPNPAVLFNFGTGLGAAATDTNLLNWVITGARSDTRAVVRGKQVQLLSTTGMVLEIY